MEKGKFVVSLDFELMWGVRDILSAEDYGKNINGVHETFKPVLDLFETYNIRGTFATVGFLFAKDKVDLFNHIPVLKPGYHNTNLSPYNGYLETIGGSEEDDILHYANSLVDLLQKYPNHEIASHTFSHYYCLENGQTPKEFEADLSAAVEIAKNYRVKLKSLVFPRNQFNKTYLKICADKGITSYRGNERSWLYNAVDSNDKFNYIRRAFRFIDRYVNLSGHNCSSIDEITFSGTPMNIPSSRFLSPYNLRMRYFEGIRIRRILRSMTYAARTGKVFHLWWHPHNFGSNQTENVNMLKTILEHYTELNGRYGFESHSMFSLASQIKSQRHEA